jgi:large subunit GTPase 1
MDCPGLVFPLIASSKAEMICSGVLPLSSMVDYIEPIKYIVYKSHLELILRKYKLPLLLTDVTLLSDQNLTKLSRDILQFLAATRGYITGGSALPDEFKAAKMILSEFVNGEIDSFYIPLKNLDQKEIIY